MSISEEVDSKDHQTGPVFSTEEKLYAGMATQVLAQIAPTLAEAFSLRTEVVVHDLTKMPRTIAAIANPITQRSVGGPPTDLSLLMIGSERGEPLIGYPSQFEGSTLRSTSVFIKAPSGRAVVALCINSDIDSMLAAQRTLEALTSLTKLPFTANDIDMQYETFAPSEERLSNDILMEQVARAGIPVSLMRKKHKVAVVSALKARGFFELREAVESCAAALHVTRYTIYNYLNEIAEG